MKLECQNILFFTRTMNLGGTENVVIQLCEILKPLVNKIVVCSCGGVNVEKLEKMEIRHYNISDIENKSPYAIFSVSKQLNKILKKEEITIIHVHHRMAAFYVSFLRLYKKYVFIATSHNVFHDKYFFTHFAYKKCNVIACGEFVKKNLVDFFKLSSNQVTVIKNSVKPFDGKIVDDKTIKQLHKEGCFIIGNVGRLSKQKGMEFFILSIPDIIKRCPNAKFVIIGKGEDENKLKELSRKLSLDDYLFFLGYRNDIQNIMIQLDLVVLSSLWEGLPLTPIEAFSVGKTIVATSVDGTVEIVKDGESGFLVAPSSTDQIVNRVIYLIENNEERKKMEKKAKETYEDIFSFYSFSNKIIDFYRSL